MGKFIYQERDDELLKKRMEKTSGFPERDGIFKKGFSIFKPKVSQQVKTTETNRIRILPPTWKNAQHYGVEVWVHYNIGQSKSTFICNKLMGQGDCPICEEIARHKDDKEYTNKIKPNRKVIVWLVDREDEQTPKLWALPVSLDRNLAFQANDEDSGKVLKIDHPERGYDVYFDTVKGAVEGIPYVYEGEKIARTSKPIFADEGRMADVLEYIQNNPVPEVLNFREYKYIKNVFEGNEPTPTSRPVEDGDENDGMYNASAPEKIEVEVKDDEGQEQLKIEVEITYEEIEGMGRDDLEDLAVEKAGVKNREVRGMSDVDLRRVVAERLGIVNKKETTSDRLNRQLERLGKR